MSEPAGLSQSMSNPRLASTQKRRSFAEGAKEALGPIWKLLRRDPLSTLLLSASIVLLIVFFSALGSLGPEGKGEKVPLSTLNRLADAQRLRTAEMLDYDHQAVVTTDTGIELYADYPGSDAGTQDLYSALVKGGARVQFDPQSGKGERTVVVQFLLPILILVCLFAFFIRQTGDGTGGVGAFSVFG
ncbi:MAG TPA: cell division protein FtsH, partial [Solirubrobacterales bacterium]|nr:cell division protein FtsH [Solirubrobacterales bacterium]